MSVRLKEIHQWLFRKIQQLNKRNMEIKEFVQMLNSEIADKLWAEIAEDFGEPLNLDAELSLVADLDNISDWLKEELTKAESREAIFIKKIKSEFPNESDEMITGVFEANALRAAYEAKETNKYQFNDAFELQKVLNDYWLSSMPCIARSSLLFKSENLIDCTEAECPKAILWRFLDVDKPYMQKLYFNWVKTFIGTLNPGYF